MNSVKWPSSPWVFIAQWIEHTPSVWKIMGSICVWDLDSLYQGLCCSLGNLFHYLFEICDHLHTNLIPLFCFGLLSIPTSILNLFILQSIGKVGKIKKIDADGDVHISYGLRSWVFHPDAVTKVKLHPWSNDIGPTGREGRLMPCFVPEEAVKEGDGGWGCTVSKRDAWTTPWLSYAASPMPPICWCALMKPTPPFNLW